MQLAFSMSAHFSSHVTRFQFPWRQSCCRRQQVSHRVVELGQVHANPGSEEDDVAHQGFVLKSGAE